jgi:predicted phage terminase large subunit-like protein
MIVQSWDTASKDNSHSDWSVCITALVRGRDICIIDVHRARLVFPDLRSRSIELAHHQTRVLLIEDQASGMQLIQTLRADSPRGVPSPIARRPETDKVSRVHGISAMIEAGRLHLPAEAPWLAEFTSELLSFPNGRYDDQVDALCQLLDWARQKEQFCAPVIARPIIVSAPRRYGP